MTFPAPDLDSAHDPGPGPAMERALDVAGAAIEPIAAAPDHLDHLVRIGTASWTDPTMVAPGVFYPAGADSAEERLHYYASQFPLVEVDATYYALPSARTSELWRERTPPDFTFDIKAHAALTGQPTETKRLPKDIRTALPPELAEKPRLYGRDLPAELRDEVWRLFRDGLAPLRDAGQLGSVLLQYPRWFFPSSENRDAILEAHERLQGLRCAVEFRHGSWLNEKNLDRTIRFLADHAIPLVVVDGPQGFRSSMPVVLAATSPDLAIVRFHGRRTATWEAKNFQTVERFRYLYDRGELADWVPRIQELAEQVRDTHVLMNNCYANYGSTNARELAAMLVADLEGAPG